MRDHHQCRSKLNGCCTNQTHYQTGRYCTISRRNQLFEKQFVFCYPNRNDEYEDCRV